MTRDADRIIGIYQRHADAWSRARGTRLVMEQAWLDRFLAIAGDACDVLDIGCGSGQPLAAHLISRHCTVTGIDSSPQMIAKAQAAFPDHSWLVADMRNLELGRTFNGLLAWDSFFHLPQDDQRSMFAVFACHARAGAALMFTSGPDSGVAIGELEGEPLFHASLSPDDYRDLLDHHGFDVAAHISNDPDCGGRTIWLARRR